MSQLFDLSPYAIKRPEKVAWRLPVDPAIQNPLDYIKSSGQRKFLESINTVLEANNITYQTKVLDAASFQDWLPYYEARMSENDFSIIASTEWYEQRTAEGKTVEGMFFYQEGALVCSGIFLTEGSEKATFAFKASNRIDLTSKSNSSIGAVVDFFFIREMLSRGFPILSAGRSRNAFGFFNTEGYLEYKLRFGYQPTLSDTTVFDTSVPLAENGCICFFGIKNDQLTLFSVRPENVPLNVPGIKILPATITFEEIIY